MAQGIGKKVQQWQLTLRVGLFSLIGLMVSSTAWAVEDTICAVVKIEIPQELTLERQGFEAIMKINNALEDNVLTHVGVEVLFQDAAGDDVVASNDPNHPNAKFFIRIANLEGIDNVAGTGELEAASSATVKWLIIPAPGTGGDLASGALYYVGAKLSYRINGIDESLEVAPDTIFVKPMPNLTLDYFLPTDVYADDPLTADIEPIVPFTLGVRVRNNGKATASKVKIESAQPQIVENIQGLLIDFKITDSFVDELPVNNSLLLDFGDIASNSSATGRWIMQTSLSGRFTEFDATFTHADELGGSLTSLIDSVNAHLLIHDIQVDLPGRDNVRDFLASQSGALTAFESDSIDTPVMDNSGSATLTSMANGQYKLQFTPEIGAVYIEHVDVTAGNKQIVQAVRSDGKVLPSANVWQSKTYDKGAKQWLYSLHLFDTQSTGEYILDFTTPAITPSAPVLQFIPNWTGAELGQIGFLIEASDPNGDAVSFSVNPLPSGATLTEIEPGKVRFNWQIAAGQAGNYPITVTASDGSLFTNQAVMLTVFSQHDTDGDGLDDDWERLHFGDLSRDGSGDYDGDGISDKDEFDQNTDPTLQNGPLAPVVIYPNDEIIVEDDIVLIVENSINLGVQSLHYYFEVYADPQMSQLVFASDEITESVDQTQWVLPSSLIENAQYYWRARSYNGILYSPWVNSEFSINRIPEPPTAIKLNSPVVGTEVDDTLPLLSVMNASDPDGDELVYQFNVYSDDTMSQLVATSADIVANPQGVTQWRVIEALDEGSEYFWNVTAKDESGLSNQSDLFWFSVYGANLLPSVPTLVSPALGESLGTNYVDLTIQQGVDPEGDELVYHFELDTEAAFTSTDKQTMTLAANSDNHVVWTVSELIDNQQYHWRVRAEDSLGGMSEPMLGQFGINLSLTAPIAPVVDNPGDGSWVQSLSPVLTVHDIATPNRPIIAYEFEVYADEDMSQLLVRDEVTTPSYELPVELTDNTWYYWRVRAIDSENIQGEWSSVARFFVNDKGVDEAPSFTWTQPQKDIEVRVGESVTLAWEDTDPDSDALISLSYVLEQDAIVIDNSDEGFAVYDKEWKLVESSEDGESFYVLQARNVNALAKWESPLSMAGRYDVQVFWPQVEQRYVNTASYSFPVENGDSTKLVTKKVRKIKAGWTSLGEYDLASGDFTLFLQGKGRKNRVLIADKVRLVPVDVPEQIIAVDIPETIDEEGDRFIWDTQSLAVGEYQVLARIADATQQTSVLSPFTISIRSVATLVLDNADATAQFDGNWTIAPAVEGVWGADIHEIDILPGENDLATMFWSFDLDTSGWHEFNFKNIPGYSAEMLNAKLVWGDESIELNSIHSTHSVKWASLGRVWLDKGLYQLVVTANGQGKAMVDAVEVQQVLVASGDEVTIDNRSLGFTSTGNWSSSTAVSGYEGVDYIASCHRANAVAEWKMFMPESGTYEVLGNWTSNRNRASRARYSIDYAKDGVNQSRSIQVNQRKGGGKWQSLGVFDFDAAKVAVSLKSKGVNGCIVADAIKFKKVINKSHILDNVSESFTVTRGWWNSSHLVGGYIGRNYQFSYSGEAFWHMQLPEPGLYRVEATWPAHFFHTSKAQYSIVSNDAVIGSEKVSQRKNGGTWHHLGDYQLDSNELNIFLNNKGYGFMVADAIRVTKVVSPLNSVSPPILDVAKLENN